MPEPTCPGCAGTGRLWVDPGPRSHAGRYDPCPDCNTEAARVRAAVLEEREGCARLAETKYAHHQIGRSAAADLVIAAGQGIAAAIRARGEEEPNA